MLDLPHRFRELSCLWGADVGWWFLVTFINLHRQEHLNHEVTQGEILPLSSFSIYDILIFGILYIFYFLLGLPNDKRIIFITVILTSSTTADLNFAFDRFPNHDSLAHKKVRCLFLRIIWGYYSILLFRICIVCTPNDMWCKALQDKHLCKAFSLLLGLRFACNDFRYLIIIILLLFITSWLAII